MKSGQLLHKTGPEVEDIFLVWLKLVDINQGVVAEGIFQLNMQCPGINAAAEKSQLQLDDHQQVVHILNNYPLPQAKDPLETQKFRGMKPNTN